MNNLFKVVISAVVLLSLGSTVASASAAKGQKLYSKKLKKDCGMNGGVFAAKHTQDEWDDIGEEGMSAEIKKICPKATKKALKAKYMKDYFDFSHDYASDSGSVPSC